VQAVNFLAGIFGSLDIPTRIVTLVENKPILIATWEGSEPQLPSILLNSHYDVVPADQMRWNSDPFNPLINSNGDIFARGTQDMKSVCMQYIEAITRLKKRDQVARFKRTIHLTFVPDEEIGGTDGLGSFVDTEDFRKLNVGLALDEGLASPNDVYTVFYGERVPWWVMFKASGNTGHGSRFIKNTAMEKLIKVVNKALQFRAEQEAKLHGGCNHGVAKKLGDVVTLNLTVLKGFVEGPNNSFAFNVIPSEAEAGFDIRIPPSENLKEFEALLNSWAREDEGVTLEFKNSNRLLNHHVTSTDGQTNPWWEILTKTLVTDLKLKIEPEVFPAATDSRFVRKVNIPCFGFSPMKNTPILLHDHNEFINQQIYLDGIDIYHSLIPNLANAQI